MDAASFIGFPKPDGQPWWDTRANEPIARMMSIASLPRQAFVNTNLGLTGEEDVVLANGLSFGGSSGSPVILHSKGIKLSGPLTGGDYVPAKLIGIMSGHRMDGSKVPPMLAHTGISYFTRSTSVLELFGR